ncbi:XRE family transcriptional regulator [Streptomyces monashensis]|uniref:helix-turn-helix domain-containing protein n=1 Tax=Streptomyces monashensis TaxID=1678012 RepID=UPI00340B61FB
MSSEVSAGSSTPQEFVTRIGGRIRTLRKQRGWSVQRLAEAGGLSRRMLTDIELGQANPSLATVDRVARALDTDFAVLALPERGAPNEAHERVEGTAEGTLVWQAPDGSRALLLGATEDPRAELWRWTLAPGGRYDAEPDRPGAQEIHHVLSGRLTLTLPAGPRVLSPGQSAVIATDQEYAYTNDGTEPAVFVRVVAGA